jgi:hypothetical protein
MDTETFVEFDPEIHMEIPKGPYEAFAWLCNETDRHNYVCKALYGMDPDTILRRMQNYGGYDLDKLLELGKLLAARIRELRE